MPAGQFFELYNAADDLLARNLGPDRAERVAVIDSAGEHTFAEIASAANRFAHVLESAGVRAEQRVLLALDDTVAFPILLSGGHQGRHRAGTCEYAAHGRAIDGVGSVGRCAPTTWGNVDVSR